MAKKPSMLALILLISFPSVAAVLISPILPAISRHFAISNGYAQQVMTFFIVGYAIGQLLYSPIANRFGRKIAIYSGIGLYLLGCVISVVAIHLHNFPIILLGRVLMAIGSAVGMVISYTIISDVYSPEKARSAVSYMILAYAFMPAIAVTMGGFIATHLSWYDCYYVYFCYGILIFLSSTFLPETLQQDNIIQINIKLISRTFIQAFSNHRLVIFSIVYGLISAFVYVIASGAPFIAINHIKISPIHYGLLIMIAYACQFSGGLLSGKFNKILSIRQMLTLGYSATVIGSVSIFICFLFNIITVYSLIIPLAFIMFSMPLIYSNITVMTLADYPDKATGSAVMSFITMIIILIFTLLLSVLPQQHPTMMPLLFLLSLAISFILLKRLGCYFKC